MAALNQTIRLQIETLVSGVQNLTSLGGTLNTLKAAAAGVAGALFVDQISAMVQESNKANLNMALFSRTMAIYGQNVEEARKKTDDFAVGMGISRNVMQENISQLVKLGLSVEQSIQLTEATLDTAAAMGTSAESAMSSLQSSMVTGMSIYLNNIGIIENFDVSLNALAQTLGKNVKQLTDSERAQAQMNHIMKFAAQDAGTYGSQMSGIIGTMAQYDSKMRDVRRTIGEALTPAWEEAWKFMLLNISGMKDWLIEGDKAAKVGEKVAAAVKWGADTLNHMKQEAKQFEPALKSLAGAFGNIITFLTRFVTGATEVEEGTDPMHDAFEGMASVINPVADGLETLTSKLELLEPYMDDIANALKAAAIVWVAYRTGALLAAAATTIVTLAMSPMLVPVLALTAAVAALYYAWKYNFGGIREQTEEAWETLKKWWKNIKSVFDSLKNFLSKAIPEAWEDLKKVFVQRLDESPFVKSLKLIPGLFEGVLGKMAALKDKAVEFWNWIKLEVREAVNDFDGRPDEEGGERYTGVQKIADLATRGSATLNKSNLYGQNAGTNGYGAAGHDGYDFRVGDFGMRTSERIYAPFSGMATLANSGDEGYGRHIKLVDDLGQTLILAHLKNFDKDLQAAFNAAKNKPIYVQQGTLFGEEGSSGNSTAPHLHLGALDKNGRLQDINKMTFQSMGTPKPGAPLYTPTGNYTTGSGSRDDFGNRTENASGEANAQATADEIAKQEAALKKAEGYAKRQVALMKEAELAKTDEQRKNVSERLGLLKKEVDAWKAQDESYNELYQITFGRMRRAAKELEEQQQKAREAEEKLRKERLLTGQNSLQAKIDDAQSLLKLYNNEVTNAEGRSDRLLAIEKAWGERVLAARRTTLNAQAALNMQKADEAFRTEAMRWDETTKKYVPKVEDETLKKLETKRDADKARIQKDLQSDLDNLTNTTRIAMTRLSREAADQARNDALTILDAQTNARQARLQIQLDDTQRIYRKQIELAEQAGKSTYDVEVKYGRQVRDAKLALVNQQTLDAVAAATITYERTKREMERRGANTDKLTEAYNQQISNINAGGAGQKQDVRDDQIRQEKEARQAVARIRAENNQADAQNALDTLQNQLAKGAIAWEKAESQRLAATLRVVEAQRVIEVTGAEGNQTRINQINKKYATLRQKEIIDSENETRERAKSANDTFEAVQLQELENRLEKGKITRAQFEEENFTIRAASLSRNAAYELRNTALTTDQRKAIEAKLQQDLLKLQIDGINAREEAIMRAQDQEAALARKDAEQRYRHGKDTLEEFIQTTRQMDEEALNLQRQRALRVNKDGAEGASRIWRQYYLDLAALDIRSKDEDRQRTLAHQTAIYNQNRASLQNQLSDGLMTQEEYNSKTLQLELDRIDASYQIAVDSNTKSQEELIDLFAQGELDKEALRIKARQQERDRDQTHQKVLQDQEAQRLRISLTDRLLTQEEYSDTVMQMEFDRIDKVYDDALMMGQKTSQELIDIYETGELQKEQIRADKRAKEYAREQEHQKNLNDLARQELDNQYAARQVTTEQYEAQVTQMELDRIDKVYTDALASGEKTSQQLIDIYDAGELQKEAIRLRNLERDRQRAIAHENEIFELQQKNLEFALSQGSITQEGYEQAATQMAIERLDSTYLRAVKDGKMTSEQLLDLFNSTEAQKDKLRIDYAQKDRSRQQNLLLQQRESYKQSLNVEVMQHKMSVEQREQILDAMSQESLLNEYQQSILVGKKTTDELILLWNNYLNAREMLSAQAAERDRRRALEVEAARSGSTDKMLANRLGQGDISVEEYERQMDESAKNAALRARDSVLDNPESDDDARTQAHIDYTNEIERIDLASSKRISDRRENDFLSQNANYLSALQQSYEQGNMTFEAYSNERLITEKDNLEISKNLELGNTLLTEEQRELIRERYRLADEKLEADSVEAKRQMNLQGLEELRQANLESLERQYRSGLLSASDYLRERTRLQNESIDARHAAEIKAAKGDENLIKAADERLRNARASLTASGVQTEAEIKYSGLKVINDLEMGALENLHNAKLISETDFMNQRQKLLLEDLEARRQLELASIPVENVKDRQNVNTRFDQSRDAMVNSHAEAMKNLSREFQINFAASNKLATQWNQNKADIQDLDKQIAAETDTTKKHQLELMKYAKIGDQIKLVADTIVSFLSPALQAFTGMSGKMADEWAEDMTRMVEDVFDLGKSILVALGNGDWVTVAIKGLQIVANWFTRNAKAAKEAADAAKAYGEQFTFNKEGYGTRTVNQYTTGILFWKTTHYDEKIDEEKKKLALGFEGAVINGFQSGFAEAIKKQDISIMKKSIRSQLAQTVLQGMIDAFMKTAEVAAVVGPMIQELMDAFASGDEDRIDAAMAHVEDNLNKLDGPMNKMIKFGKRISDAFIPEENVISEAWRSVLDSAMSAMFKGDDPLQAMYDSIRTKLQESIRDGFIMKRAMEQLQPLFDKFDQAIKDGVNPAQALAQISAQLPGLSLQLSTDLAPILAAMNLYLPQALNANTSAVNANTNQMSKFQFQDTTVVNYQQIGGTSRVRSRLGVQL